MLFVLAQPQLCSLEGGACLALGRRLQRRQAQGEAEAEAEAESDSLELGLALGLWLELAGDRIRARARNDAYREHDLMRLDDAPLGMERAGVDAPERETDPMRICRELELNLEGADGHRAPCE